jgi:hypothetical protein
MRPKFRCRRPILVAAFLSAFCVGQASELQGSWKAEFKDSLGTGTASVTLTVADSQTLSGTYQTDSGGIGTLAVKPQGNGYKFILTQTVQGCTGSFVGEFGLSQGKIDGTYSGTDCKGWHENGVLSMVRGDTRDRHSSAAQEGRKGYVECARGIGFVALFSSAEPSTINTMQRIPCGDPVGILGEPIGQFTRVRTKSDQEGFVNSSLLHEGVPQMEAPVVIKEVPTDTVIKQPSRIPTAASQPQFHGGSGEYPLSLRVLQTEQVPYSVQYGGGGVSTNCSIGGSTYTTGSATSVGNYTYGSAISNTDLSMRCNSYENPPMQWRHVLNAMLVVASNGNAYIMACDAAWRWSKCRGLITGDTFQAKMTSKGMVVQYYVGGKTKEGTYSILQGKVLRP